MELVAGNYGITIEVVNLLEYQEQKIINRVGPFERWNWSKIVISIKNFKWHKKIILVSIIIDFSTISALWTITHFHREFNKQELSYFKL